MTEEQNKQCLELLTPKDALDALETALRQWEYFSDEKRDQEDREYAEPLSKAKDYEGQLFRRCKDLLRGAQRLSP